MSSPLADREKLSAAIEASNSTKEVLMYLGLRAAGGNYAFARHYADKYGLILPSGCKENKTTAANLKNTLPDELVFCVNSTATRTMLKRRLRKIWPVWNCAECNLGEIWNNKPISLQLDHINGIHNDSRLENLRLLCPNCHTQTDTFAGRNCKPANPARALKECLCGKFTKTGRCVKCRHTATRLTKIDWPSKEDLLDRLRTSNYSKLSRELGVSDNAIRKYLKR